jgi:hypothetical protein
VPAVGRWNAERLRSAGLGERGWGRDGGKGKQDWGDRDRADEKGLTRRGQRTRGWKRYGRGKDGSVDPRGVGGGRRGREARGEGRWWIAAIRGSAGDKRAGGKSSPVTT